MIFLFGSEKRGSEAAAERSKMYVEYGERRNNERDAMMAGNKFMVSSF